MSLFGGDGAVSLSSNYETETEHSDPPSAASSSSCKRSASPPNAQDLTQVHQSTEFDDEESVLSEIGSSIADNDLPTRPNRFQGVKEQWRRYTAADRQVAASLEQIQSSDLAAHLYNAHALKRRVRRPVGELEGLKSWQSRDNWLKSGHELNYVDVSGEMQTDLIPAKDWTAWPVPPAGMPTPRRQSGRRAQARREDGWMIGGTTTPDAGEELRGELLATFLRNAKEQWKARETASTPDRKKRQASQSMSRSRSRSAVSACSVSRAGRTTDGEDEEKTNAAETEDEGEGGKKRGRPFGPEYTSKPTFLADDSEAERILQPTINSILSKVDELALAIRRTRLNHFGREDYGARSSASEFTSGAESRSTSRPPSSRSRSTSRPAKVLQSRPGYRPGSRATSVASARTPTKARRKNRDISSDIDSSSESDVSMGGVKQEVPRRKRSRAGSTADERSPSIAGTDIVRESLMDWSEVLGLAAVKGWDERAIARTAQRCAALFGESMSFVPLSADIASQPVPARVEYAPSTIPAPDISSSARPSISKRPYFPAPSLRCPHPECYAHQKDFEYPYRVVEHCQHVHGYDPRTNDSDNEDKLLGGVHIDGYLQRITGEKSWVQRGKKRQKKEEQVKREVKEEVGDVEDE